MYVNTTTNPLSGVISSFDKNTIIGRLANGVSGDVHVVKKYATLQSLQKDEFISTISDSKPSEVPTYTKRNKAWEKHSNQISESVVDESAVDESVATVLENNIVVESGWTNKPADNSLIPSIDQVNFASHRFSYYGINTDDGSMIRLIRPAIDTTIDHFIDINSSDVRYNDMLRFYNDKAAMSKNGEHISAELLAKESLSMGHMSLSEWERKAVQREEYARLMAGLKGYETNAPQSKDSLTLAKWKNEYYEHLKTTGKSYYSEVSQKEAEDKFGDSVNAIVGVDTGKQQYLISIISYGSGESVKTTDITNEAADFAIGNIDYEKLDERLQSNLKSPIMSILSANNIILNNKEGFTIEVGIDGVVKLGESNIKDETKIAAIKQAVESDETLGQQLIDTCRNDGRHHALDSI